MKITNNNIEYIEQLKSFYTNSIGQIKLIDDYLIYNNIKIKLLDLLPINYADSCAISKSIILHIHSTIFFISKQTIQNILQLESEIHSIYILNDYDVIGLFMVTTNHFYITLEDQIQLKLEFFSKGCVQFDIQISFQPYRLSCFYDQQNVIFILTRNLEHPKFYNSQINCLHNIINITKIQNRLLIITEKDTYIIIISSIENTLSEQEFLKTLQIQSIIYPQEFLYGIYYHSNDNYVFKFDNQGQVITYSLSTNNRTIKQKIEDEIIWIDSQNNIIIICCKNKKNQKIYLQLYNLHFHLIKQYEINKEYQNIKYCPYYEGIIFYDTQTQYIDKEPNNNYIMPIQIQQHSFLQFVDFKTQIYKTQENNNNNLQSYIMQGKKINQISCGFVLDFQIENITNIWENRFILVTNRKIKIIEIYNNPYEYQLIYEFGILNQQLLQFRNSLPIEDLERIEFLKQSDQKILFSTWGDMKIDQLSQQKYVNGIINSAYGIKWIIIYNKNAKIQTVFTQNIQIQKVLQITNDYYYVLCNDEEVYKITEKEVILIYVSGEKLKSFISTNNETIIYKQNHQLLFTEFEQTQKIKQSIQLQ